MVAGIAARGGHEGNSVGSILGSNIPDPVFSLGVGPLLFEVCPGDSGAAVAAVGCLLLYLPSFVVR